MQIHMYTAEHELSIVDLIQMPSCSSNVSFPTGPLQLFRCLKPSFAICLFSYQVPLGAYLDFWMAALV